MERELRSAVIVVGPAIMMLYSRWIRSAIPVREDAISA